MLQKNLRGTVPLSKTVFVCLYMCVHARFCDATTQTHTLRLICHSLCASLIGLTLGPRTSFSQYLCPLWSSLGSEGWFPVSFTLWVHLSHAQANPSTTESQTEETVWGERLIIPSFDVGKKGEHESGSRVFLIFPHEKIYHHYKRDLKVSQWSCNLSVASFCHLFVFASLSSCPPTPSLKKTQSQSETKVL